MNKIRVAELFAGVGGFRVGLERASQDYEIVWSNQWEPSTKSQHASDIYVARFGSEGHSNQDISTVPVAEIPDHDMLVGGFPCQDYSVAKTLKHSAGIEGKKGVLWWDIHRILSEKEHKPKYLLLENVDRLLKSPVKQRGRDFAIMLASLSDLGYAVEWRVINAADYGMPQRRRRVFLMGYHVSSSPYKQLMELENPIGWLGQHGLISEAFPVTYSKQAVDVFQLSGELDELTTSFNQRGGNSPFENAGLVIDRKVYTVDTTPIFEGIATTLGDILEKDGIPDAYYINEDDIDKWNYLKGAKKEKRVNKATGYEYDYSEGGMVFPDALDRPSRTIITGEGGSSASRFKHVIRMPDGRLRRLMPIELERLNMFPDNHTEGASDVKRAFFMGNALVVGIIEKLGRTLQERLGDGR